MWPPTLLPRIHLGRNRIAMNRPVVSSKPQQSHSRAQGMLATVSSSLYPCPRRTRLQIVQENGSEIRQGQISAHNHPQCQPLTCKFVPRTPDNKAPSFVSSWEELFHKLKLTTAVCPDHKDSWCVFYVYIKKMLPALWKGGGEPTDFKDRLYSQ